jgi:hypothetical protein
VVFSSCQLPGGGIIAGGSPTLIPTAGSVLEGNAGTTTLNVPVLLLPASASTVTVNFATSGLTATPPTDYTETAGTLTFPPGTTVQNVQITVNGDVAPELNEQILITFSNPSGAPLAFNFGLGTITDDDSPIAFRVDDTLVVEGNAGTTNMVFTVRLSRPSAGPTSVDYQTVGTGTAIVGVDFTAVPPTTLNIPANTTSATFIVPILTDTIPEPDKTVGVLINNPVGGNIIDGDGVGTIIDDDGPPSVSIASEHVTEGCDGTSTVAFSVLLNHPAATTVTANFTTANGSAQAGTDYQAVSGTLTFNPGETLKSIEVQVIGDQLTEPDETFQVNLTGATGATIAVPSGTGTILNDD